MPSSLERSVISGESPTCTFRKRVSRWRDRWMTGRSSGVLAASGRPFSRRAAHMEATWLDTISIRHRRAGWPPARQGSALRRRARRSLSRLRQWRGLATKVTVVDLWHDEAGTGRRCTSIPMTKFSMIQQWPRCCFDLAPEDWSHCGEYRVVYSLRDPGNEFKRRFLLIFEAMVPNPYSTPVASGARPGAGR